MPTFTAEESSLSSWAGPYVTEMLGRGQALAGLPYQPYMGPLTAGQSTLQDTAFQGLAGLNIPTNQQMTYNPQSFTGMAPTAPTAQQPMASVAVDDFGLTFTPEQQRLRNQRREAAGPGPTTADLFKALGMAPPTAQQGQMPSSIFEGLGGTASGAALDSSLAVQRDIPYYMADHFGSSGTNTVEDQATAREMGMTPLQYAQAGGMGANVDQRAVQAAAQQPMQQSPIEQYMSPYLQGALDPQYAAAQRQADISAQNLQSQFGKAGAYGGSRQGVAEAELQRGLLDRMAGITGTGYQQAFEQAQRQFNTEQDRQMQAANQAQRYGLDVLREQQAGGATQRGIESQGIAADIAQFEQERDYDKNNTLFMQSLLQGLPLETQSYSYVEPSGLQTLAGGASDVQSILDLLSRPNSSAAGGTAATPQYDMNALANYKASYMASGMDEQAATTQAMKDIGMIS